MENWADKTLHKLELLGRRAYKLGDNAIIETLTNKYIQKNSTTSTYSDIAYYYYENGIKKINYDTACIDLEVVEGGRLLGYAIRDKGCDIFEAGTGRIVKRLDKEVQAILNNTYIVYRSEGKYGIETLEHAYRERFGSTLYLYKTAMNSLIGAYYINNRNQMKVARIDTDSIETLANFSSIESRHRDVLIGYDRNTGEDYVFYAARGTGTLGCFLVNCRTKEIIEINKGLTDISSGHIGIDDIEHGKKYDLVSSDLLYSAVSGRIR